jgi:hypothetical protein
MALTQRVAGSPVVAAVVFFSGAGAVWAALSSWVLWAVVPVEVVSSGEVFWFGELLAPHPATSAVKNAARTANFLIALLREAIVLQKAKSAVATADNRLFTELPRRGLLGNWRHKLGKTEA